MSDVEERVKKIKSPPKEIEIDGERIFLKKSYFFGWGVVHPYKVDGKFNWKNALLPSGSYLKLAILLWIILVILGFFYEYSQTLQIANECLEKTKPIISFG